MNQTLRLILASVFFLGSVGAFLWVGRSYISPLSPFFSKNEQQTLAPTQAIPELFYKTVGASPALHEAEQDVAPQKHFSLEIKSVETQNEANKVIELLDSQGIKAYYTPMQSTNGRVLYRIRKGIYPTMDQAEMASSQLKSTKNINTQIVELR